MLLIVVVCFTILSPGKFLTTNDFSLISQGAAPFLVMAVGETFVILTAGIDLSVGFVLVLSGVVAGEYYIHNGGTSAGVGTVWLGVIIGLATGAGDGLMQGFLVAKAKIPPLIATLAGLGGAEGLSYLITGGHDLATVPSKLASSIGQGSLFGVQWLIVISFLTTLLFGLILAYTSFGRYTYAIGSNRRRRGGSASVDRHLILVYGVSGLMACGGGIMNLAYFSTTTISGHPLDNLVVITAVVLGGASLLGAAARCSARSSASSRSCSWTPRPAIPPSACPGSPPTTWAAASWPRAAWLRRSAAKAPSPSSTWRRASAPPTPASRASTRK